MKEEVYATLRDVGLSPYEIEAYQALLSVGSATPVKLVGLCKVPRSRIYGVLGSLVRKGFASMRTGKPTVYEIVPPEFALKKRIEALRREAYERIDEIDKRVENVIPTLAELSILSLQREPEPQDIAWVYYNEEKFRSRITELIRDSKKSFSMFTSAASGLRTDAEDPRVRKFSVQRVNAIFDAIDRGVDFKSIHDIDRSTDLDLYLNFIKKGSEIRVPTVELRETFWVIDGNAAAIVASNAEQKFQYGLILKNQFVSELLLRFFDEHWKMAIPAEQIIQKIQKEKP